MSPRPADPAEVLAAVMSAGRHGDLDPAFVARIVDEELSRAGAPADAVKRVKRRLHQLVGAYQGVRGARLTSALLARIGDAARSGDPERLRETAASALIHHASTRERARSIDRFHATIWRAIGQVPSSILDLGCGLHPLSVPWMGIARTAHYSAVDVDRALLSLVDAALTAWGQAHETVLCDLAAATPPQQAEVALLLKVVPLLDRQRPDAAVRLLREVRAAHAVLSFPVRSLGGRPRGMARTYRRRMERLVAELGATVSKAVELEVEDEIVFVLGLAQSGARDPANARQRGA